MADKFRFLTFLIFFVFVASGCAGIKKTPPPKIPVSHQAKEVSKIPPESKQLKNIEDQEMEAYVQKQGVIFGKTDFQGVLKTIYVKLLFEHESDPEKKYQLYIGDPSDQNESLFDVKTVSPGYFFIELPEGKYKLTSVSIPVGSTLATEDINVELDVNPDAITYVGTLKINGTKERIKLGGVPIFRPGFEYTLDIIDDRKEAVETFKEKYPSVHQEIEVHLMRSAQSVSAGS